MASLLFPSSMHSCAMCTESLLLPRSRQDATCRLANHESSLALMSPEVRNQLNGHHVSVGHDAPSGLWYHLSAPQEPQWQFSIAYVRPVCAMRYA